MPDTTTELLQKHFGLALEAPDGIAKLRELILTLAMQGKLVPQDPNDPPASELLRELRSDKVRLLNEGKIRDKSGTSGYLVGTSRDVEKALPLAWSFAALSDFCDLKTGATPSTSNPRFYGGEIKWLVSGDINRGEIFDCEGRISNEGLESSNCSIIPKNSLLIALNGQGKTRATVARLRTEAALNQSLVAIIPHRERETLVNFLFWYLRGRYRQLRELTGDDKRSGLNMKILAGIGIPLPPLPEQRRIVAKIDQLMEVCDDLEKKRDALVQKRLAVHNAAIRRLLEAEEVSEFSSAWDFLVEHFGEVYSVKENVAELRKAILQLAVMGKLVKQDPNDPPASELLKEIEAEKRRLVKEGKIKADDPANPQSPRMAPFEVPNTWEWVRLQQLLPDFQNGLAKRDGDSGEFAVVLRLADVRENKIHLDSPRRIRLTGTEKEKYRLDPKDILITRVNGSVDLVGSFVKVGALDVPLSYCDHFIRMRISEAWANQGYLHMVSRSRMFREQIEDKFISTAGQKTVNQVHIGSLILPLPPLPEQHRIVAKVDQLMALCDRLEAQIDAATAQKTAILKAVLDTA